MIKLNAYLLAYVLFFVCLFLLLLLLDKSGALKSYSSALHESSFKSKVYMPRIVNVNRSNKRGSGNTARGSQASSTASTGASARGAAASEVCTALLLESILRSNIERRRQYDELIKEVGGGGQGDDDAGKVAIEVLPAGATNSSSRQSGVEEMNEKTEANPTTTRATTTTRKKKLFDSEFHDYLLLRRCDLGCGAIFFERGLRVPLLGVMLREGLTENFLLYLMNNHSIVSCVYACKESSHSRNSRRWVLIVQHAVGFFITNIVAVVFLTAGVGATYSQATAEPASSYFTCQLFDIFVTAPIALAFGEGFRRLYRCDVSVNTIEKYPRYVKALSGIRKGLIIPLVILGVFLSLVICAILTTGKSIYGNIVSYVRDVFMVTIVLDFINSVMNFVSTHHLAVYLFGGRICLLSIGQLYVELLIADGKKEGVDYRVITFITLRGLLRIDRIVDIVDSSSRSSRATLDKQLSFMQINPMHRRVGLGHKTPEAQADSDTDESGGECSGDVMGVLLAGGGADREVSWDDACCHMSGTDVEADFEMTNPLHELRGEAHTIPTLGAGEEGQAAEVDAVETGDGMLELSADAAMEDEALRLRRFGANTNKDFRAKFHFFQARDMGYTSAENVAEAPIVELRRAANLDDDGVEDLEGGEEEGESIGRGGDADIVL